MSPHNPWVTSARKTLEELERRAEQGLDAVSAYRVLALLARLDQARAAGLDADVPDSLRRLGERANVSARLPSSMELLERLDAALANDDDPFGELLDVLIHVDDVVSVGEARVEANVRELAILADARVSLSPTRVGALGAMAERRLATLPPIAAIRGLWATVARSAVEAAVEELPSLGARPGSLTRHRLLNRIQARHGLSIHVDVSQAPVVRHLAAVAASEVREPTELFEQQETVGIYEDDGILVLHVNLPPGKEPEEQLELHVRSGERSAILRFSLWRRARGKVLVQLGSQESLRARLRSEGLLGAPEELQVEVMLALKESGNGR